MPQGQPPSFRQLSDRLRARRYRHVFIGVCATALVTAVGLAADPSTRLPMLSIFTAYVALALLAASLAIGPMNVLHRRPNPINNDTRRIVGSWAAAFALLHTMLGLNVHMGGRFASYFLAPAQSWFPLRLDLFGWSNHAGLIAAVIFAGLLLLSNDYALRRLGVRRWKNLQRSSYVAFALVVLHGIAYQFMEKRTAVPVLLFALLSGVVVMMQVAAYVVVRQRSHRE